MHDFDFRGNDHFIKVASVLVGLVIFFIVISFYSPLLSFYIPLLILCFDKTSSKLLRMPLMFVVVYSGALITSSRQIAEGFSYDDFMNVYYPAFLYLKNGGSVFYGDSAGGIEFILYLFFKVINYLFVIDNPRALMFFCSFFLFSGLYIWIEKFGLKKIKKSEQGICISSVFVFFAMFSTTLLIRQGFASIFILFSLGFYLNKDFKLCFLFFILAFFTHTSSLIVAPIYYLISSNKKKIIWSAIIAMLTISLLFNMFVSFVIGSNAFGAATTKFIYYSGKTGGDFYLTTFLKILPILMIGVYHSFSEKNHEYKNITFYGGVLYLIFLYPFQLSERLFMISTVFLTGFLVFLSISKYIPIYRYILSVFIVYKIFHFGPYFSGDQLSFLNIWNAYPWAGNQALYYMRFF